MVRQSHFQPTNATGMPSIVGAYKASKTVWPSGLRRWLEAPFRKGVGSNPTAVSCLQVFTYEPANKTTAAAFCLSSDACCMADLIGDPHIWQRRSGNTDTGTYFSAGAVTLIYRSYFFVNLRNNMSGHPESNQGPSDFC